MKKNVLLIVLFLLTVTIPFRGLAQLRNEWVNQVIVGNGGKFETQAPYQDYVTLQTYDPETQVSSIFATIYTQSIQDILIVGNYAYVAAQDSILKFDIDTYTRVAGVADSGVSRLSLYNNNRLIVTKQYPIKRFFVEVLNAENLALLARVQNISGECGDVFDFKDSLYVAVNGGYLGTEGKLAIINANTWTLSKEINFGPQAVGITDLYEYNGILYSVNKTPYGGGSTGSFTGFNLFTQAFTNYVQPVSIGSGIGQINNIMYVKMNEGVGSFNMSNHQIVDTTIIPDPGSINHIYILSGATDYVNNRMYLNIGVTNAFSIDVVTTTAGDSLTSFQTGINPDAIAVDYRTPVGIGQESPASATLSVFPNPVSNYLKIRIPSGLITETQVSDLSGRVLITAGASSSVDCSSLPAGMYILRVKTQDNTFTTKFIKK